MSDPSMDAPGSVPAHLTATSESLGRAVIRYFRGTSTDVATVEELREFVSERDECPDRTDEERIALRLHHATLPKLADHGHLDYDPRTNTVRYRDD